MNSASFFTPKIQTRRVFAHLSLLLAVLLALWPVAGAPQIAAAQDRASDTPAAVSADASEEIVYIDSSGVIKVLDTQFTEFQVQWVSPDSGWRQLALGDFNSDGDKEIVAVKGTEGNAFIAVFDPVVTRGEVPVGNVINGIPWKELARISIPQAPQTVVAGNFDTGVAGDEFAIIRDTTNIEDPEDGDPRRIVIYHQNGASGDGASWSEHYARNFGDEWELANMGNWDNAGGDEIVLVDNESGKIEVYQPDQAFRRITEVGGRNNKYALLANYVNGGNRELLNFRDVDPPDQAFQACNLLVNGNPEPECMAGLGAAFSTVNRGPRIATAGDVNGSSDEEAFMIFTNRTPPMLVARGAGDDGIIGEFLNGIDLNAADEFEAITSGDIDGDGKDEVILAGRNRIMWYQEAHNSASPTSVSFPTNRRSIVTGDLDRNGFNAGPRFGASISSVETTVNYSFVKQGTFTLQNNNTDDVVSFEIALEGTAYTWLSVFPSSGFAPGKNSAPIEITYVINGNAMTPNQTYNSAFLISSPDPAVSSELRIPIKVDVELPPLSADPPGATAVFYPCQEPLTPRDITLQITGIPGRSFSAFVTDISAARAAGLTGSVYLGNVSPDGTLLLRDAAGNRAEIAVPETLSLRATDTVTWPTSVPWITSVSSVTNTVPTAMTLAIDPAQRTRDYEQAALVLLASSYAEDNDLVAQPYWITLNCANNAAWLPLINRH